MHASRPTRLCPHRLCRPLHSLACVFTLIFLIPVLWHGGFVVWGALAVLFVASTAVQRLFFPKGAMRGLVEEEMAAATGSQPVVLLVRKGWARTAVVTDWYFVLGLALMAYTSVAAPHKATQMPVSTATHLGSLALGLAPVAFSLYAHKKATDPVKAKRAPVVVPSGT
ncbi:hypothetical protein ACFZAM_31715 [Streptomyces sp. NPDC008079]|uniref:hypothetical protein n=1 Tax=Streptomyces sp. NPDC008079 TaxID=3364806 RepID=UPI0036E25D88